MTTNTRSLANLKPFKKGEGGRPKGARNKLGEEFLDAIYADFRQHGKAAIEQVRQEKPDAYLKVVASLVPRQIDLAASRPLESLSDDELMQIIGEGLEEEAGAVP